jgi:hypothetical protein
MNYIELINQFWQMRRSKRITSIEADLYFYLLKECNERHWENPFSHPNMLICATIGCTEKTLIEVRNRLKQKGLIDFEPGERRLRNPVYILLYCKKVSKTESKEVSKTVCKTVSKTPNILNKQNKTKLNKNPKPPDGDLPDNKDFIDELIDCFSAQFIAIRGIEYYITNKGKERAAAAKILATYKKKYPEAKTNEVKKSLEKFFAECIYQTADSWLYENMSLLIIVNKLNVLNQILKHGKTGKNTFKSPAASRSEVVENIAAGFARGNEYLQGKSNS